MSRSLPRRLSVVQKQQLTPNMLRITLGGESMGDFPPNQESGYVKLIFPPEGEMDYSEAHIKAGIKPRMRSYTIRYHDGDAQTLVLDFAAHGEHGPASAWAMNAKVGDEILVREPGPTKLINPAADWFFLAGDMTALPAIGVNLEKLPPNAKGYAVIEVLDEADKQVINAPSGIELIWVVNAQPEMPNTCLSDKVKSLPWLPGEASVWSAMEFETMKTLRRYFRDEKNVSRDRLYISSYWKMGATDEGHKQAKKSDTEA
ncbi:siderophore-interacting protein [Marinibactrum halimedae]|uniref:Siderophore-interacting protein n=1 Tax=Marinibactrum halimedae TaxID=1444977 RepID=A0AA37T8D4_9GAMM|nr:siderophore-interacting protein [Marinibactrum halimedae]MCD9459328.1 siderophore-interacting protein [Marinibactrum halimedae]GLS25781.1 siderophore-interacting protein [Marinibactrum halimedae]